MLRSKWFTYLILAFIGFSYISQKTKTPPSVSKPQESISGKNIEAQVGNTTNNSLTPTEVVDLFKEGKSGRPSATVAPEQSGAISPDTTEQNTRGVNVYSANKNPGFIEKKIVSVLNNLLETEKGKELIEKILTTPQAAAQKDNATPTDQNLYTNNASSDITEGVGERAYCGQRVTLNYILKNTSGEIIKNTKEGNLPVTVTIGDGQLMKGIEYALIGMRKGGLRKALLSPSMAEDATNKNREFLALEIELLELIPSALKQMQKIQVFDSGLGDRKNLYRCGDTIAINYQLQRIDGTIIYDSSENEIPKIFVIGNKDIPAVINKISEGIGSHSTRTAIAPVELLNNFDGKKTGFFPTSINVPKNELLLIKVESE